MPKLTPWEQFLRGTIVVGLVAALATIATFTIAHWPGFGGGVSSPTPSSTIVVTGTSQSQARPTPTHKATPVVPGPYPISSPSPVLTTPPSHPTPTPPPSSASGSFDFENGTQGWGTSEGAYKLATVGATGSPVHSGSQGLKVTTLLRGDAIDSNDVDHHTEATVYFNNSTPSGLSSPPYNLSGKPVSCWVYLPSGLATGGTYIRIFVKDTHFANDFSNTFTITSSNVNRWIQLSLVVGADPNNADSTFDATNVNALGIRIETSQGSSLNYNGSFYIDDCVIG